MLYFILAVIGGVLFSSLLQHYSFIWGAIIGLIIATVYSLQKRVGELESALRKQEKTNTESIHQEQEKQAAYSIPQAQSLKEKQVKANILKEEVYKKPIKSMQHASSPATRTTVRVEQEAKPVATKQSDNTLNQKSTSPPTKKQTKTSSILDEKPSTPSGLEKLFNLAYHWFTDGNTFVRIGIIVLFFGFSMLFKEAYDQGLVGQYFPIELRLIFAAIFAFALLFFGWRLSKKQETYGLLLQGAAIGILYLTTFAALSLYNLIPTGFAFAIFTLLCIFSMWLAVIQNSKSLAIFSAIGGFLAPILTSTGSNNYIGLFSFYALLNTGILAVAVKKSWRLLNLIGFGFTFAVASIWGGTGGYQPEFFATTEPFLIFFFLLYVAVTVLFAIREQINLNNYVDSSLLFGVPVLGFSLQALMVDNYPYGLAISAFVLGAFYILLAYIIQKKYAEKLQLLSEAFLALGAIFATLSIPFALDHSISSVAWVLEGAGIVWISVRQEQKYRRLFGLLIQFLGTLLFANALIELSTPIDANAFSGLLISGTLVMAGLLFSAWSLFRHQDNIRKIEKLVIPAWLIYGAFWFFSCLTLNNLVDTPPIFTSSYILAGSVFMLLIYTLLAKRYQWQHASFVGIGMMLPAVGSLLFPELEHPAQSGGFVLWILFFSLLFYLLSFSRHWMTQKVSLAVYTTTAVIISGLLLWEGVWLLLLGMTMLSAVFVWLGNKNNNKELDSISLTLLPVMAVSMLASIILSKNIVSLPSIGLADLPFDYIGAFLWPIAFAVAFVLLNVNQTLKQHPIMRYAHYFIAALIVVSLAWIGLGALLLGASLLAIGFNAIGHRYHWQYLRELSQGLLPIMLGVAAFSLSPDLHSFKLDGFGSLMPAIFENGYVLWPLSFIAFGLIIKQWKNSEYAPPLLLPSLVAAIALFVTLTTWEMAWHLLDNVKINTAWFLGALPIFAVLTLWILMKRVRWPVDQYRSALNDFAGLPIALGLALWSIWSLFSSGDSAPIPWIPILNPLDLMQIIIIFTLLTFSQAYKDRVTPDNYKIALLTLAGFAFVWLNIEVLRAISHWVHIPWKLPNIIKYPYSQTALAVLWTLLGIALTFISGKKKNRMLWMIGAGLLVIVVIKLFLFDFQAQNGVARIISFISVGALLLLVGYISPLPPAKNENKRIKAKEFT